MKTYYLLILYFLIISGCSQTESDNKSKIQLDTFFIEQGWVRSANAGMMSAAYFRIHHNSSVDDTLKSISSNISTDTQIHQSFEKEENMMTMREVGSIPIKANSITELKPGGMHVMIIRPNFDILIGDSVEFTLVFANFGELEIKLPVRSTSSF